MSRKPYKFIPVILLQGESPTFSIKYPPMSFKDVRTEEQKAVDYIREKKENHRNFLRSIYRITSYIIFIPASAIAIMCLCFKTEYGRMIFISNYPTGGAVSGVFVAGIIIIAWIYGCFAISEIFERK